MENEVVVKNIDLKLLKEQKLILINMIQSWEESDDESQIEDAKQVEGLLYLLDYIQDQLEDNYDKE